MQDAGAVRDLQVIGDIEAFLPGLTAALRGMHGDIMVCAGAAQIEAARARAPRGGLVVLTLPRVDPANWDQLRATAELWAFTRWAALAWAPAGTRVNALSLAGAPRLPDQPASQAGRAACVAPSMPATADDAAAAIGLMWRARSMTGQLISLG